MFPKTPPIQGFYDLFFPLVLLSRQVVTPYLVVGSLFFPSDASQTDGLYEGVWGDWRMKESSENKMWNERYKHGDERVGVV